MNYDECDTETALKRVKSLGPEHKDARVFFLKPRLPGTVVTFVMVSPAAKGERLALIEEKGEQCLVLADPLPEGGCVACTLTPVPIIDAIAALREANPEAHKALRDAVRSLAKPLEWASEKAQK